MKKTIALLTIGLAGTLSLPMFAQTASADTPAAAGSKEPAAALFATKELVLDIAGTYTAAEPNGAGKLFTTNARHGIAGASFGATYFGTLNFGMGIEAAIADLDHTGSLVIDSTTVTVMARLPLGTVAPYALAGLGRNFHDGLYNTQAGAGVEWRFSRRVAVFSDARFVFQARQSADTLLARTGVRFAF